MVASAAAVTFEWRASDGWPGVLTLTASLPTLIPAANLIAAVTLLSFATVELATRIAAPVARAGRSGQADTSNIIVRLHRQPADAPWWD